MEGRTSLPTPILSSGIHTILQDSACVVYWLVFHSNGHLDPWSGGGVLQSVSPSLVAMVIHDGAHHLDLRAATSADPCDVIAARSLERQFISQWIKNYATDLTSRNSRQ